MFSSVPMRKQLVHIVDEENAVTKSISFQSFWVHTRQLPAI